MAKPKISKSGKALFKELEESIREAVFHGMQQLWDDKESKIHDFRKEDRANKVKIGFAIDVDTTEAEPIIGIDISITKTIKAGLKAICDDIDQGHFDFIAVVKGGPKPKKSKAKKGESAEPDQKEDKEESEPF